MTKRIAIASGYFNPLHVGHLRMICAARSMADMLVVIVNNDVQQVQKKGKIITAEDDRLEIISALRTVDRAIVSVDVDNSVCRTLEALRSDHPDDELVFVNGGDRRNADEIAESETCAVNRIEICFGIGGADKADSSSRINTELGVEVNNH